MSESDRIVREYVAANPFPRERAHYLAALDALVAERDDTERTNGPWKCLAETETKLAAVVLRVVPALLVHGMRRRPRFGLVVVCYSERRPICRGEAMSLIARAALAAPDTEEEGT